MLRKTVKGFQHVALLLARIAVGVVLITRGWHRWFGTGIDAQVQVIAAIGLPSPVLLAWLVTIFELAGGVLLVFGLFTPLIGLGTLILSTGIAVLRHSDAFAMHADGYEYYLVLGAIGLMFFAFGSGKFGADALFSTPREPLQEENERPPSPSLLRKTERTLFTNE